MGQSRLPSYSYDTSTGQYRDSRTGRFIKEHVVYDTMQNRIDDASSRMNAYADAMIAGDVSVEDWRQAMIVELRRGHVQMAMLGAGGNRRLSNDPELAAEVWGRAGFRLKEEYGWLNNFADEIAAGKLSPAQIKMRMKMYSEKVWTSYHDGKRVSMRKAGKTKRRRIAKDDEGTCKDCKRFEGMGWVDIDDPALPPPGVKSVCRSRCRCTEEYGTDAKAA